MRISNNTKNTLNEYLINVLNIPMVSWGPEQTIAQKDRRRKQLHDKLVKELNLQDREIISACTEYAYSQYLKNPKIETATNGFMHELMVKLGENPLTKEEEAEMVSLYDELAKDKNYDEIKKNFYAYCNDVRKKHILSVIDEWKTKLSEKTNEELLELLKKTPDEYMEYCKQLDKKSNSWFDWEWYMDFEAGYGFGCIYYVMEEYFWIHNFYHDRGRNIGLIKDGIKRFKGDEKQREWIIKSLASIYALFDGVREYLNTPWTELVKIFLSFKNKNERKTNE